MIPIGNTIVSDEVIKEKFVCDLNKCKGACCVEGESGAPLEDDELEILEKIYDDVKPYLTKEGIKAIEKKGCYHKDSDGDWVTPLIKAKGACAYTIFENGIAQCGIEKAFRDGKTDFQKPVSCHLYPVRITKYKEPDCIAAPAACRSTSAPHPAASPISRAVPTPAGRAWTRSGATD